MDVELFFAVYDLEFFNGFSFGYFLLLGLKSTWSLNIPILVIIMKERIFIFIKHLLMWVLQYFRLFLQLFLLLDLWFTSPLFFLQIIHVVVIFINSLDIIAIWLPFGFFLLFRGTFCELFIFWSNMSSLWLVLFLLLKFKFCQVTMDLLLDLWKFIKLYFWEWFLCVILVWIWNYKRNFVVSELRAERYVIKKILLLDFNLFEVLLEFFLYIFASFKNF